MRKVRIKICCIQSVLEARLAVDYGAAAVGLVGRMPSGPGVIDDHLIASIAAAVPPPIATFLLTSETAVQNIIEHHQRTNTNTIQIVDQLSEGEYSTLTKHLPALKIIQVIHINDESAIEKAQEISHHVHALLLDSGNPHLAVKELGGTGRVHNWKISRKIVDRVRIPVFLAGGLDADNAQRAIDEVQPFGLDICSGVRTDGHLDESKLAKFFQAAGY